MEIDKKVNKKYKKGFVEKFMFRDKLILNIFKFCILRDNWDINSNKIINFLTANKKNIEEIRISNFNINVKKELITNLIEEISQPKIEETNNGLNTPFWLIDEQLDLIDKKLWSNKNAKILIPVNKMSSYSISILGKFMVGLRNQIPNKRLRYNYILENILYVLDNKEENIYLYELLFNFDSNLKLNIFNGSLLNKNYDLSEKFKKQMVKWGIEKFDLTISNLPFQEKVKLNNIRSPKPIYNLYFFQSKKISNKIIFITSSRWFSGNKIGLGEFRKFMLNSNKIRNIKHYNSINDIYPNANDNVRGGISYFYYDVDYDGYCNFNGNNLNLSKFDVLVPNNQYGNIINKIKTERNLSDIYNSTSYCGISTNDYRLLDDGIGDSICWVSKNKGLIKSVNKMDMKMNMKSFDKYKIITPEASGKNSFSGFGNMLIVKPNEYFSQTYISFTVNSKKEANNLFKYLNTEFVRFLLGTRKITHHISKSSCKWIPLIDLTQEWNDEKLFDFFKLSDDDIKIIQSIKND